MEPEIGNFETEMNRGFLQILVLALLEKDMYGYSMVRTHRGPGLRGRGEHPLSPSPPPREERLGPSKWDLTEDRPRKFYAITDDGPRPPDRPSRQSGRTRPRSSKRSSWRRTPMSDKLEAYLEEISHFLSGRAEREEILSEIRSHILEKAAEGPGRSRDAAIEKAIAAFGPARQVAEKYLDDRPIIAPAYKRYLFRYTTLLFAAHAAPDRPRCRLQGELHPLPLPLHAPPRRHRSPDVPADGLPGRPRHRRRGPLLHHPERQGRQAPLAQVRRRPRRGQAADEELLGEPHRHGHRRCHHAGHHRLRPLSLRQAPDHLLRQPGLDEPAAALHPRRRAPHLAHRHRRCSPSRR